MPQLTHIYKDREILVLICLEKRAFKNNHTLIQHNSVNSQQSQNKIIFNGYLIGIGNNIISSRNKTKRNGLQEKSNSPVSLKMLEEKKIRGPRNMTSEGQLEG